ncbi:hypothetical protein [Mesoterricola silvestris]|uniref:Uncharacterized protein n=1 Tax=Mesoterricola silvestris TaxID=2927979 RepID=A0AA48KAB7_9BACT|nr:hypothetical protein [Mesoterricola silvestris]BDU73147.1 hypothetical protein METEAL_23210 [Mesoterricola silvestris]
MKRILLATLIFPIAIVAAPGGTMADPSHLAETWVREAVKLGKARGIEGLVAEVQNPAGKFWPAMPEMDPELTIYSSSYIVLAVNRPSKHVGMDHAKMPDAEGSPVLKKMRAFAEKSGHGWYEYVGTDALGHPKAYKAYLAIQGGNLIAAVLHK